MTDQQNEQNGSAMDLAKYDPQSGYDIDQWGVMADMAALGRRLKQILPGGKKLKPWEAIGLAQYAHMQGANPFRGEIYGYSDRHGFHLVDGYKLLVRWAQERAPYVEHYTPLSEGLNDGDIGYTCHILRRDNMAILDTLCKAGMNAEKAFAIVATSAGGVVCKGEKIEVKGWTRQDVARKRALKNCLNRSHGAPAPGELSDQSWNVNGTQTQPQDWAGTAGMSQNEREATAEYQAHERERHAAPATVENAPDAIGDLFAEEFESRPQKLAKPERVEDVTESDPPPPTEPPVIDWDKFNPEMPAITEWPELRAAAVERLLYHHSEHVRNTLKRIFNGQSDEMTLEGAWTELVDHQRAKMDAETEEA